VFNFDMRNFQHCSIGERKRYNNAVSMVKAPKPSYAGVRAKVLQHDGRGMNTTLEYATSHSLKHAGDCHLLGVRADGTVYVEEWYGDGWAAQHVITIDGDWLQSVDEDSGAADDLEPLALPPDVVHPQPGWQTVALNFVGPRHRGLREPEHMSEAVQPFSIHDRMTLVSQFQLPTTPPMLLGLAESYVLAEAPLHPPQTYVICRRVRLAYALPTVCRDADNQPYDYDTAVAYLAQIVDLTQDLPGLQPDAEQRLPEAPLHRPMDCAVCGDWLVVADGGSTAHPAQVHWWRVIRTEKEAPDEALHRKLYGA
jgi:hypothetical protein